MADQLFDVDTLDPGQVGILDGYARWPVTVHAVIHWSRGPGIEGDALSALLCGCLKAWGIHDAEAGDIALIPDPDYPDRYEDSLHHEFSGTVPGHTVAHANEQLRDLIDRALDVLEYDWERIERLRTMGDYRAYRPPMGA